MDFLIWFGECGVKVVIDDFGIGYLFFSYLCKFLVDGIKIDCSFIMNMD